MVHSDIAPIKQNGVSLTNCCIVTFPSNTIFVLNYNTKLEKLSLVHDTPALLITGCPITLDDNNYHLGTPSSTADDNRHLLLPIGLVVKLNNGLEVSLTQNTSVKLMPDTKIIIHPEQILQSVNSDLTLKVVESTTVNVNNRDIIINREDSDLYLLERSDSPYDGVLTVKTSNRWWLPYGTRMLYPRKHNPDKPIDTIVNNTVRQEDGFIIQTTRIQTFTKVDMSEEYIPAVKTSVNVITGKYPSEDPITRTEVTTYK